MAINKRQWKEWDIIGTWLEQRQLVGDINGFIGYWSYEDIKDLFRRLYGEDPPRGKSAVSLIVAAGAKMGEK